jgi:hypothetical protein
MLVDYTISEELPVNNQNGFDSSQPCSFAPHFLMTNAMCLYPIALAAGAGANGKTDWHG